MDTLPCGYNAAKIDCIDCCGYGECGLTEKPIKKSNIKRIIGKK